MNLMIERDDRNNFKYIESLKDLTESFGCYLLIHEKSRCFYIGYSENLNKSIKDIFHQLNKKKHACEGLQYCNEYHYKFNIYVISFNTIIDATNYAKELLDKYRNSNLLLNKKFLINTYYTEFEVQATAYANLLKAGYNVRGEYRYKCFTGRGARFDLVILDGNNNLLLILEVKRSSNSTSEIQAKRYMDLTNIKTIYIKGMYDAENVVSIVKANIE